MSIVVKSISHAYGSHLAVDALSFEVKKGEILGFLGPNGAGKSTTIKMITGTIKPDQGSIVVAGYDVVSQATDSRRKIGYLPENNPLYEDLFVEEYLLYAAGFYPVQNFRLAVDEALSLTGLQTKKNKKIGTLSKGYRQRVGIAQAIVHRPEVLILDEPTSGLDPNQLNDIHRLIRQLGAERTVMFSTHALGEAASLCSSVLILKEGKCAYNGIVPKERSLEEVFVELTG